MGSTLGFATGGYANEVLAECACYAEKTAPMSVMEKASPTYSTASTMTNSSSADSLASSVSEDYSPGFDRFDDRLGTFM